MSESCVLVSPWVRSALWEAPLADSVETDLLDYWCWAEWVDLREGSMEWILEVVRKGRGMKKCEHIGQDLKSPDHLA